MASFTKYRSCSISRRASSMRCCSTYRWYCRWWMPNAYLMVDGLVRKWEATFFSLRSLPRWLFTYSIIAFTSLAALLLRMGPFFFERFMISDWVCHKVELCPEKMEAWWYWFYGVMIPELTSSTGSPSSLFSSFFYFILQQFNNLHFLNTYHRNPRCAWGPADPYGV